jgi:hypothetical protein
VETQELEQGIRTVSSPFGVDETLMLDAVLKPAAAV